MTNGTKTYRCTLTVRGYELDSYGHVNHAVYLNYLEQARWELLAEEGIRLSDFDEWKRWPVIAEVQLNYLKPTLIGELLNIETEIVELSRTSVVFQHTITRDSTLVLRARIKAVTINEKGRPAEHPEKFATLFARALRTEQEGK